MNRNDNLLVRTRGTTYYLPPYANMSDLRLLSDASHYRLFRLSVPTAAWHEYGIPTAGHPSACGALLPYERDKAVTVLGSTYVRDNHSSLEWDRQRHSAALCLWPTDVLVHAPELLRRSGCGNPLRYRTKTLLMILYSDNIQTDYVWPSYLCYDVPN